MNFRLSRLKTSWTYGAQNQAESCRVFIMFHLFRVTKFNGDSGYF